MEIITTGDSVELEVRKVLNQARRDLLNVKIRATARLNGADPWQLRIDEAMSNDLDNMFLVPIEEEQRTRKGSLTNISEQLSSLGYGGGENSSLLKTGEEA